MSMATELESIVIYAPCLFVHLDEAFSLLMIIVRKTMC